MSQRQTFDGSQGFAVGSGLTSHTYGSNQQLSGMMGLSGSDGLYSNSQRPTHPSSQQVGNTFKLIASLGLSPSDLDVLAQIPEESITVETLPHLLQQLKNRKADQVSSSYVSSSLPSHSLTPEPSYRGSTNEWENMQGGRMDWSSANTSQTHSSQGGYGYSSSQDVSSHGYNFLDYSSSSRKTTFSEPSSDPYQSQGMSSSFGSDSVLMQPRTGTPSNGKIQDYLGAMPVMFPYVCALCDFDVHSTVEWTQHISGMRHAENCRVLLNLYPDWNPHTSAGQMSGSPNWPKDPFSDVQQGTGMSYSHGPQSDLAFNNNNKNETSYSESQQKKGKVVVIIHNGPQKPSRDHIFSLAAAFGRIHESLLLNQKSFLEFETHEEAVAMASYYKKNGAVLNGIGLNIYVSKDLMAIEKRALRRSKGEPTCVVFFSNMPKQKKEKSELLQIASRFGRVVKHLFLTSGVFLQMSDCKAAANIVKYYSENSLIIGGKPIQASLSKHKTLNVNLGKGEQIAQAEVKKIISGGRSNSTTSVKTPPPKKEEGKKVVAMKRYDNVKKSDGKKKETEKEKTITAAKSSIKKNESTAKEQTKHDGGCAKVTKEPNKKVKEKKPPSEKQAKHENGQNRDDTNKLERTDKQDNHKAAANVSAKQMTSKDKDKSVSLNKQDDEKTKAERGDSTGNSNEKEGVKVVNVVGFQGSHGFFNDILALAKPFGKVVKHLVVRTKGVAFLQLESEKAARAMTSFYNGNAIPSVSGRRVQIQLSKNYCTLQDSSVIRFGKLPSGESVELSVLRLAAQHGKIKRYSYAPTRTECFVEMEKNEDAVNCVKAGPYMIENNKLEVHISKKHQVLIHGLKPPSLEDEKTTKRELPIEEENSKKNSLPNTKKEEPPKKKMKTSSVTKEAVKQKPEQEKTEDTEKQTTDPTEEDNTLSDQKPEPNKHVIQEVNEQLAETQLKIPETTLENLGAYDPNVPVGMDLLKMGFYCKLCFQFYSSEDAAKKLHCSSEAHYDKLKKNFQKKKPTEAR